jgi:hypothetical protein
LPHNGAQRATAPESSIEARFDKSAVVALRDIGCSSHVRMPRTPAGFFRPPRAALNDPPEQSFAKFGPGTAKQQGCENRGVEHQPTNHNNAQDRHGFSSKKTP